MKLCSSISQSPKNVVTAHTHLFSICFNSCKVLYSHINTAHTHYCINTAHTHLFSICFNSCKVLYSHINKCIPQVGNECILQCLSKESFVHFLHATCSVMYSGINASLQPNMGPDPDSPKPEAAIYFVLYMFLMPFVLLNLFVGFVIVTFQKYGVKSFRKTKLDRNQVWLLKSVLFCTYLLFNRVYHHLKSMWLLSFSAKLPLLCSHCKALPSLLSQL